MFGSELGHFPVFDIPGYRPSLIIWVGQPLAGISTWGSLPVADSTWKMCIDPCEDKTLVLVPDSPTGKRLRTPRSGKSNGKPRPVSSVSRVACRPPRLTCQFTWLLDSILLRCVRRTAIANVFTVQRCPTHLLSMSSPQRVITDTNRAPLVQVLGLMFLVIAVLASFVRSGTKIHMIKTLKADDILAIVSSVGRLVSATGCSCRSHPTQAVRHRPVHSGVCGLREWARKSL